MNEIIKEKESVEKCSADFFNYRKFLEKHHLFPLGIPIIHVAGTNGKGSVSKIMAKILNDQGMKVGLFTSPHLVNITERIQIQGQSIEEQEFNRLEEKVTCWEEECSLSYNYFQRLTTIALQSMKDHDCDIIILETGLGGRWDSTNVFNKIDLIGTIITKIGYDHKEILGNTLSEITWEKAGIIKEGVPLVTCDQLEEVKDSLSLYIKDIQVIKAKGPEKIIEDEKFQETFIYKESYFTMNTFKTSLTGFYQGTNLALALSGLNSFSLPIKLHSEVLKQSLMNLDFPGRMDFYKDEENRLYLLEGAHNPMGIDALVDFLEQRFHRIFVVTFMLNDKDSPYMLKKLSKISKDFYYPKTNINRGTSPVELSNLQKGNIYNHVDEALAHIKSQYQEGDLILFTGSLYFIGDIIKNIRKYRLKRLK
ncbi:MAG: Mur ligase family protein [Tissierellia bacterium]|nr:Mur ligase family protein [Tissierellia bacterium]